MHAQTYSFKNPLPIPYTMSGTTFVMDIHGASHNFDPNGSVTNINLNVPLETYTYNETGNFSMTYLGPTLIFQKGDNLTFDIYNALPNGVNTTVHWHGLNIPAQSDGGPHQVIPNDQQWFPFPNFDMIDPVQTVWYHTHLMNQTTDQVIRGLAGMMIVQDVNDPLHKLLPHTYGENDIPIIIQEKNFVLDSTTTPPTATAIIAGEKPGKGPYTLVNGQVGTFMRVPPEIVRLRILNGSPRKMFNIGLSTTFVNPTVFADMWMIATGGGYLSEPVLEKNTLMSVGDRREFLVDFSLYLHNDTVYMNTLPVPADADYGATPGNAIMAFIVADEIFPNEPITSITNTLNPDYGLAPGVVNKERTKELLGSGGSGGVWTIDGTPMDLNVINDTVLVNSKERWTIVNKTNKAHPFHIHKVQFQVVEYIGKAGNSNEDKTYTYPDLPNELIGYKDVQLVRAGATMTFEARFDEFPSPLKASEGYMYHCHILTHEDTSMMHQFVVVDSLDFYVGLSNLPGVEELSVFPNPAINTLSFEGTVDEPGTLRIYDIFGRLLRQEDILSLSNSSISVDNILRGTVIVEFTSGKNRYLSKVVLQ
jgi:FtsP/CotA-like multicopper oxidase with cupredoxin domain